MCSCYKNKKNDDNLQTFNVYMSFDIILNHDDILYQIIEYLPFENKIIFGKYCKKNFLKFYDFNSKDYEFKDLDNIFDEDDYIGDVIYDLKYCTIDYELVLHKYIECNKRTYIENNFKQFYSTDDDTDDDSNNSYDSYDTDDTDVFVDKICNLPIEKFLKKIEYYNDSRYGIYSRFKNVFEEELDDILHNSVYYIYLRILIEKIEEYSLDIKYDVKIGVFNLYELLPVSIDDEITEYYISSFENENIDTDVICSRCGLFGHNNISEKCIFYDKKYENNKIKKFAEYIINDLLDNVYIINQERIRKELYMCKGQNCNNKKSNKCLFDKCKNCCKDNDCLYHKDKKTKALKYKELYKNKL